MSMDQRLLRRVVIAGTIGYLFFSVAGGITLAELQLHPWRRLIPQSEQAAASALASARYGTKLENVEITARSLGAIV